MDALNLSSVSDAELFNSVLEGREEHLLDARFPFYPLTAPGMPMPGPDFVNTAQNMGDPGIVTDGTGADRHLIECGRMLSYLYRRALYDENFMLNVDYKKRPLPVRFVPGHIWGTETRAFGGGPAEADVMIIGKLPGVEETAMSRNLVGETSAELTRALHDIGVPEGASASWYVTNLVKWASPPEHNGALPKSWVRDCLPLLHEELRLVRPKYILCLGSDASKALLGTNYSVTNMVGRVVDYRFALHDRDEEPEFHTSKVMAVVHPAAVFRKPELSDEFVHQLRSFWQLTQGGDVGADEDDIDHVVVNTEAELRRLVDQAIEATTLGPGKDPLCNVLAVDAEWNGDHPFDSNAYLRCIQVSWRHKQAMCVELRSPGGEVVFDAGVEWAMYHLGRLLKNTADRRLRVGGHFFRADLPWILHEGLDLRLEYMPDLNVDLASMKQGGWDTGLMYHAYNETTQLRLEDLAMKFTTCPRWDEELESWKSKYCKKKKIKATELEGYGECPSDVLYPYANYDADATRRLAVRWLEDGGLGDQDAYGNNCTQPYWLAHSASEAFLEMEMWGITVDRDRADELTLLFSQARDRLLNHLRAQINWPDFNPNSTDQKKAFLFGDEFAYKEHKDEDGRITRTTIRPADAISLNLKPVKTTGKRAKKWEHVESKGETDRYSPSTDKEVLGALGYLDKRAATLRDINFTGQVLKSSLRMPVEKANGDFKTDRNGNFVYPAGKGLIGSVCADGRVRTHLFQTKETGRASSSRPPMQNLSKRREDDYKRILGHVNKDGVHNGAYTDIFSPLYRFPLRTILRAAEGHVLIESDFTGAELAMLAWMSQDAQMIEDVARNNLPETHPDHYDIHSQSAVRAFRLQCAPTKKALKDAGCSGLRVAAKNVNFGIPYGRGAEALARQCAEEGVDITVEQAQQLIDAYFSRYTQVEAFLAACRDRVNAGWMSNCFGRFRRFPPTSDRAVHGEQERQAQNFPIQSGVADAMNIALANLANYRRQYAIPFRFLLQIHDAVLLEVPVAYAEQVVEHMMPTCMVSQVPIVPCRLDGSEIPNVQTYNLGVETDIGLHWGEQVPKAVAREIQLPEKFAT